MKKKISKKINATQRPHHHYEREFIIFVDDDGERHHFQFFDEDETKINQF